MKISISFSYNINEYQNEWDAFLPTTHHLKSEHLLAFEYAQVENIQPQYLKIFIDNELAGLIYLQQFSLQRKHINFNNSSSFTTKCVQALLPTNLTILVCGHLFRIHYKGYYFKNSENEKHIFECINIFIKQTSKPSGIIIKDADTKFENKLFQKKGFRYFDSDVTMEVTRRYYWSTFNDYLADLNKKYLQRAKKIILSFNSIVQKEFTASHILANTTQIEQLYNQVVDKQTIKLGYVNAAYFYELKKSLHTQFEFHALYNNNIMVGFYTFIFYNTCMETHFIGLNYEANKTHNLYFNILFLGIKKMIEKGYDSLELGRTAKDAKINVGAMPSPIINYIKVKNVFANLILNCVLSLFKNSDEANLVKRHPLKEII